MNVIVLASLYSYGKCYKCLICSNNWPLALENGHRLHTTTFQFINAVIECLLKSDNCQLHASINIVIHLVDTHLVTETIRVRLVYACLSSFYVKKKVSEY